MDYDIIDVKGCKERHIIRSEQMNVFNNKKIYLFVNNNTQSSAEYIFARALVLASANVITVGQETCGLSGQAKEFLIGGKYLLSITTKRYLKIGTEETIDVGIKPLIVIDDSLITEGEVRDSYIAWYYDNKI